MNRKQKKDVVILGAGGHAHVVADIVTAMGNSVLAFLDDNVNARDRSGSIRDYKQYDKAEFIIGIGDANAREKLSKELSVQWFTAVHPSAIISKSAKIGAGTVVMPNAVINSNACIGNHCIINSGSVVEHDNEIGDFTHIAVGAKIGGTVTIGEKVWIGIGATVTNNVAICNNCIVGAGAVVIGNIDVCGTYVGVPSRRIK